MLINNSMTVWLAYGWKTWISHSLTKWPQWPLENVSALYLAPLLQARPGKSSTQCIFSSASLHLIRLRRTTETSISPPNLVIEQMRLLAGVCPKMTAELPEDEVSAGRSNQAEHFGLEGDIQENANTDEAMAEYTMAIWRWLQKI